MNKATLRQVYLEKRRLLTGAEHAKRNQLLTAQLKAFFKQHAFKSVHVFLPISKNKEADLSQFIDYLHTEMPEIRIGCSISDLVQPKMTHFLLESNTLLKPNKWGIPEPVEASIFDLNMLDCVLVPMVAGSKSGHRIGYGKGYYDRFLHECPDDAIFVGVNLGPLLEGDIFAEAHDIQMDYMITPFENFKTKRK